MFSLCLRLCICFFFFFQKHKSRRPSKLPSLVREGSIGRNTRGTTSGGSRARQVRPAGAVQRQQWDRPSGEPSLKDLSLQWCSVVFLRVECDHLLCGEIVILHGARSSLTRSSPTFNLVSWSSPPPSLRTY